MAESPAPEGLSKAIIALHYAAPPLTIIYWAVTLIVSVCMLHNISKNAILQKSRQNAIIWLLIAVIATCIGDAATLLVRSVIERGWWASQDTFVSALASILVWGIELLALTDTEYPVWYPYYGSWLIALTTEVTLFILSIVAQRHHTSFDIIQDVVQSLRIGLFVLLPCVLFVPTLGRSIRPSGNDEENQALLSPTAKDQAASEVQPGYGTKGTHNHHDSKEQKRKQMQRRLENDGNWWNYMKSYSVFVPLVWPSKDRSLQVRMLLVGVCLLLGRALNVLIPRQLGIITNALTLGSDRGPWLDVLLFTIYSLLNSSAGVGGVKNYLWFPVEQYSYRALSTAAYNKIMELDSEFHNSKRTGELFTSIDQGRSVGDLLESVIFDIVPMLIDLVVACGYLYYLFGAYMALLIAFVSFIYIWTTVRLSARRSKLRRSYIDKSRREHSIMYDSVGAWQTVSYFNRISYEEHRYSEAIIDHLDSRQSYFISAYVLRAVQSTVMQVGKLVACLLAVYQVRSGRKSVGTFITLLTYWGELSGPLAFFANAQRELMNNLLDAESLLELLKIKPGVQDRKDAKALQQIRGAVEFEDVSFSYDPRKPTLKDIRIRAEPGQTVALVGETGGGKSTLLKLLFRFYDISEGSIKVDGQDIRDIQLQSLRDNIGVVPQDPTLFNDSILVNVRYARLDATDEDVHNACKAAAIHDKIMTFPDGYDSKVGERGLKLSGGELQRVSIARAILKDPKILLLDEATSMVDTETEHQIQQALTRLTANRTTFMIAHRLSTIMNADVILVISNGSVVEHGTHKELKKMKGKYYNLWSKQVFSKNDSDHAKNEPQPVIFNDLTSECGVKHGTDSSEAEPYSTTAHENPAPSTELGLDGIIDNTSLGKQVEQDVPIDANQQDCRAQKGPINHFRDKIFRPDAPEFIPQFLRKLKSGNTYPAGKSQSNQAAVKHIEQQVENQNSACEQPKDLTRQGECRKEEKSEQKSREKDAKRRTTAARKAAKQIAKGTGGSQFGPATDSSMNEKKLSKLSPEPLDEAVEGNQASESGVKGKKRAFRGLSSGGSSKAAKSRGSQTIKSKANTEQQPVPSAVDSDGTQPLGLDGEGHVEFKVPIRNRRAMSKSEPAAYCDEATDATNNSGINPNDLGELRSSRVDHRGSTTSKQPTGPVKEGMRSEHVGRRRRRPRYGNQKKPTLSETASTGDMSSSWNESPSDQTPGAPLNSPAGAGDSVADLTNAIGSKT